MNKNISVIDLGNINVKYIGKSQSGIFSSKITTDYQSYKDGFQRVEIDGRLTYIGIGELSREFNKSERNYLPQLLYAVCKSNNENVIETNLTLLLPILQMENKVKLIENLKDKEFDLKFNGKDRVINFKDVLVLPEGYVTYFSLSEEDKQGDICIIDLGSRTINICVLEDGKIQKLNTVKLGSFDFYSKLRAIENAKGEDFTEEEIPRLIRNGTIKVYQKQYAEFLNEILNSIKPYVNLRTYKCIFTGGTSIMLSEWINKLSLPNFKIHSDALNSNVIGAKNASMIVWGAKDDGKQ
ncbi:ParM/StbA family protein [Clostridium sp. 001]|uniref:ParM/StbA family protein n=1 Tax=Clostridium sp. 001 TaxID=1970093 RepID=UPI001C2B9050|nr:ParM/StbA family protein [Clostridium sp. 001]QXE19509.1 heat-shock protein Hsp70 [Clostridium sp. 001]